MLGHSLSNEPRTASYAFRRRRDKNLFFYKKMLQVFPHRSPDI